MEIEGKMKEGFEFIGIHMCLRTTSWPGVGREQILTRSGEFLDFS